MPIPRRTILFVEIEQSILRRVRVKLSYYDGGVRDASPEYEDCRSLALARGVPLGQVYDAAQSAAQDLVAR